MFKSLRDKLTAASAVAKKRPVEDISEVALLMATLPPNVEMLEAIVLPHRQLYVGRG